MSFIAYILEFKTNKYLINNVYINLSFFVVLIKYQSMKNFFYWSLVCQRLSDVLLQSSVATRWQQRGHMGRVSFDGKEVDFLTL